VEVVAIVAVVDQLHLAENAQMGRTNGEKRRKWRSNYEKYGDLSFVQKKWCLKTIFQDEKGSICQRKW